MTTNDYVRTRTDLSVMTGRELAGNAANDREAQGLDLDAPATCHYFDVISENGSVEDLLNIQLYTTFCTLHREGDNPCFIDTTPLGQNVMTSDGRQIVAYCKAHSGNDGSGQ